MKENNERPTAGFSKWVIVAAAIIALGAYALEFWCRDFSSDPAEWGQFGDYMGGILNPIVAFGAFLWLVASVRVQERELSDTKTTLKKTLDEQRRQAEISLLTARIESLNIELSSIVNELNHYRSRQLKLLDHANRPDSPRSSVNEYGDPIAIDVTRMEINRMIGALEAEEKRIIDEVRTISLHFRFKVVIDPNAAS